MKNKRQAYIIVTVLYALLTMFVLGETDTDTGIRFFIVFFWAIVMGLTALIVEPLN